MASLSTPQVSRKRSNKWLSPSFKVAGIFPKKNHLPRASVVQQIYDTAKERQHVVIGSSAATGKTSLLQLLEKRLDEEQGATVVRISMNRMYTNESFMGRLAEEGIALSKLKKVKNTWLLLDDAQNAYSRDFDPVWQFVIKEIGGAGVDDELFVVIAATYDLSIPESPADFRSLEHMDPNITEEEVRELFHMHAEVWEVTQWENFCMSLARISRFSEAKSYHIGVVMAGIRMLADIRKHPSREITEEGSIDALRKEAFAQFLDRCFRLPDDLPRQYKDRLLDVVITDGSDSVESNDPMLAPFLRAGLLTREGRFSCIAANWYYNRRCFPNRALTAPESLDHLIVQAVGLVSAKRLKDTLVDGFPKEATFHHLFNEAMSLLLPPQNVIIPELNTAVDDSNGKAVTGELDFYVHGTLKWAVELLRCGDKIGEHLGRFDLQNGKYRKVDMRDYIIVDCRGPKKRAGAPPSDSRCTLYFDQDFKHCLCQIRKEKPVQIELGN